MTRATQITLVVLAAVAVAVLFGFVRHVEAKDSHASGCANYRDALTLALNDPMSNVPITGLSGLDARTIEQSRTAYQAHYAAVSAYVPARNVGFGTTPGYSPSAEAVAAAMQPEAASWRSYAATYPEQALGAATADVDLYHATNEAGVSGIRASGFAVSHVGDSAGCSWFSSTVEDTSTAGVDRHWLVIVAMPDAEAERYHDDYGPDVVSPNYKIPWAAVNSYQPFRYRHLLDVPLLV